MKHSLLCGVLIITAAAAGIFLRLPSLHLRPIHTDEAVHAVKFGKLLEENSYVYDKHEYHGPTLNYFTLIPASIRSEKTFTQLSEFTLRVVPVFFGVCLCLLPLLFKSGLGRLTAVFAVILTAVSPVMTFYSRYYIQEMLLVCFSLSLIACFYNYTQSKKPGWLVWAGISLGLMHATKETFIIAAGAMAAAAFITLIISGKQDSISVSFKTFRAAIILTLPAAVVSVLLFSSFFTNPHGIIDSVTTYSTYLNRAGENGVHVHPWYNYFQWLLYFKLKGAPVFTEAFVVSAAAAGFVLAFTSRSVENENKQLLKFFAFYTLIMAAVYSAIPYKTPWCLLGFYSGMLILAGYAMSFFITAVSSRIVRVVFTVIFAAGVLHLAYMSYLSNTKYASSPANPWVYAHTSDDVSEIAEQLRMITTAGAGSIQQALDMPVQIVAPGDDYWPLPWYLRQFGRIGYHSGIKDDMPVFPVVIISAPTADGSIDKLENQLIAHLFNSRPSGEKNLYVPLFTEYLELRPMVEVRGYITKDLWEKAQLNGE